MALPGIAADGATVGAPERGRERDLVGRTFDGKFLILRLVGVGGFGAVYSARDLQLECAVAIKILHRDVASDEGNLAGFLEEVRRLTRLKHPNVVGWKALARTDDGTPYFVMELLEGRDLQTLLESEKTLAPDRAARILLQIVDALRAAHRLPDGECLLHLDLKPSNVYLEPHPGGHADLDWVKVIDFGVSQFLGADSAPAAGPAAVSDEIPNAPGQTIRRRAAPGGAEGATRVNAERGGSRCFACTPEFCAPEQGAHLLSDAAIVPLDERADLYAVGAIAFRMVTGRLPFESRGDSRALLLEKLELDPPPVESLAKGLPRRLARFIDHCLERDRERRFRSAEEAYAELDAIVSPRTGRRTLALAAVVVALLGTSGWLMLPREPVKYFDLFARERDHERLLTDDVLTLGPKRRDALVRVSGVDLSLDDSVRFVADPRSDAVALTSWTAFVVAGNSLRIAGSVAPERARSRVRETAYAEVRHASLATRYSQPVALEWLGPDAVRLAAADVPRRDGRLLDPEKQHLEVQVDGRPEDVEQVVVRAGSQAFQALPDGSRRAEEHGVWCLPLLGLGLVGSSPDLEVRLVDRAGNEESSPCTLGVVHEPLAFAGTTALSAAQRNGGRWFVADRRKSHATFTLTNPADVEAELFDAGGKSLGKKSFTRVAEGDVALADFGFDPGERLFRGALELRADDHLYVLRADAAQRGHTLARLEFDCSDARPRIAVALSGPDAERRLPLAEELADGARPPYFTASRRLEVHVTRQGSVPLRVALAVDGNDAAGGPELALGGATDDHGTFQVALAGPGAHELRLRCWRQIDADDRKRPPDLEVGARCVVDETPPRLECAALESAERSGDTGVWPAAARLVVDREGATSKEAAAPVHVRFEVVRSGRAASPDAPPLAAGELPGIAPGGAPLELALPPADAAADAGFSDGRYVLRLLGSDEAGNVAPPVELPFEIAKAGPALELKRPLAALAWEPDASGSYELRAVAEDANGVADVAARLAVAGLAPFEVALTAEAGRDEAAPSEWSGRARIPRSWTRREVTLTFTAHDRHGRETAVATKREADSIARAAPDAVRAERGGATLATLRRVRGNRDAPYRFGGRSDEDERRLFAAAGLGSYNRLKIAKSWSAEFAAGAIGDYYLDDREVSVADFRAFVDDEHGYADAAHWPAGSAPDAARREELCATLRALPPARPVGDVSWNEAAAFARWAGKRLPSFVEWEYALRGGANYRPTASGRALAAEADAVGAGDVTPDTKLRDLTGGVSEWSATAADGFDGSNPIRWVGDHRAWFLRPREQGSLAEAVEFWVVGASARRGHGDFSCADRQRRGARAPDLGFRCALSLDELLGALEAGAPRGATWTECGE
jgi:serine/threonine protein kinase